jgi:Leucine-rich repeat (LRR) protein
LLLLLTAAASLLVTWRVYTEPYRAQGQSARLAELGRIVFAQPPAWIPRFGQNLQKIVLVDVADRDDPEEYLEAVTALPGLETLVVGGPQFGDKQLRRLYGLRSLHGLVLDSTEVAEAGLAEIQQALPALEVYRSARRAVRALEAAMTKVKAGYVYTTHPALERTSIDPLPWLALAVGSEYFPDRRGCLLYAGNAEMVHLKHLPNLQELHVQENITDAGMVHVDGLASLTRLNMGWHTPWARGVPVRVTDAGLAHIKGLTNLTDLSINANITDDGMEHLQGLLNLRTLRVIGDITDRGLAHVANLTNLDSLELESTYITDEGLAHLSSLKNLRSLNLYSTDIRGTGLLHLQGLPGLAELNLGATNISDTELAHLKELRSLKALQILNTGTTKLAVAELRMALPECKISHSPTADGPVGRVLTSMMRGAMRASQSPTGARNRLATETVSP